MLVDGAKPHYVVYRGTDLTISLWRIVPSAQPTVDDFRSYVNLNRAVADHLIFRATGVSFYNSRGNASRANRRYGLGSYLAEVTLPDERFMWAETGSSGHITAWGNPPSFLNCVVDCVEDRA